MTTNAYAAPDDRLWVLDQGVASPGVPQLHCHICDLPLCHGDFSFRDRRRPPELIVCTRCLAVAEFTASAVDALLDLLHGHIKRAKRAQNN